MASDNIPGLAVIGDALSDEYAGTAYSFAKSWPELLVEQRNLDLGAAGTYAEPRRTGFAFNWSRDGKGVTAISVDAPDVSVAQQVSAGEVSHVVFSVGLEEFTTFNVAGNAIPFEAIYNGTWDESEIESFSLQLKFIYESLLANTNSARSSIVATTIPDPSLFPQYRIAFPDAAKRNNVSAVVNAVNAEIRQLATNFHVVLADLGGLMGSLLGTNTAVANSVMIGGRTYLNGGSPAGTSLFTTDGFHPHTSLQAIIANLYLEAFNVGYEHTFQKFTDAQINALTGQTFVSNTLNINYASFITIPPVSIFLDYGSAAGANSFTSRLNEMAGVNGIAAFSTAEVNQLRAQILSQLQTTFSGLRVDFPTVKPIDTRSETIQFGRPRSAGPTTTTTPYSHAAADWLNVNEQDTSLVFVSELNYANLKNLSRANQLNFVGKFLAFYAAQNAARQFGLNQADAFGTPQITSADYNNVGSVQLLDYLSGDPALGFNISVFETNAVFGISPLGRAKLQYGYRLHPQPLVSVAETSASHGTAAAAQALTLTTSAVSGMKTAVVRKARINAAVEADFYSLTATAGELITAQIAATGLYDTPAAIDAVLRIFAADGVTQLAISDDTFLGTSSFGNPATTLIDADPLVLNFVAPSSGTYFIQVTAKNSGVGDYDLFASTTTVTTTPWKNPLNALDVNRDTFVTGLDAIIVVNELITRSIINSAGLLPAPAGLIAPPPLPHFDVNGDNFVTGLDALIIVNDINVRIAGGGGEGEEAANSAADAALAFWLDEDFRARRDR